MKNLICGLFFVALLAGFIFFSQFNKEMKGEIISVAASPSGDAVAMVVKPSIDGIGVSQYFQVWGYGVESKTDKTMVFEIDRADGVVLSWGLNNKLFICYGPSRILSFQNFFFSINRERKESKEFNVELIMKRGFKS